VGNVVVPSIITAVLEEAIKHIAKKVAEDKKLSYPIRRERYEVQS